MSVHSLLCPNLSKTHKIPALPHSGISLTSRYLLVGDLEASRGHAADSAGTGRTGAASRPGVLNIVVGEAEKAGLNLRKDAVGHSILLLLVTAWSLGGVFDVTSTVCTTWDRLNICNDNVCCFFQEQFLQV